MRYAADLAKAAVSAVALAGVPVLAWLGFVVAIHATTRVLDLF